MQILVLLGMYFDAVVLFVTSQTLLFRLALAILCDMYQYMLWILKGSFSKEISTKIFKFQWWLFEWQQVFLC